MDSQSAVAGQIAGDDAGPPLLLLLSTRTMLTATMAHAEPNATATTTSSLSPIRTQQEQHQPVQPTTGVESSSVAIALSVPARRKTVYFTVGQRREVAIFEDRTPSEEIKSKPQQHQQIIAGPVIQSRPQSQRLPVQHRNNRAFQANTLNCVAGI